MESYNRRDFLDMGITEDFVQDNHSRSTKGVLRGLHLQTKHPQGKLVRVIRGAVYDVAVDMRKGSPTFGQFFGIKLSEKDRKMVYVPKGFAHGFLTLSKEADLTYKMTDYYFPEYDHGIIWNDPDINISWPLKEYGIEKPILSSKDQKLPRLKDVEYPFTYNKHI